ncbi:hypothetical protein [Streptomyces syringium]|uniref:hypothetical protein n=1 Tax=Streptomyces syringium TaxID=76729 RepID=UPI003455B905
MSSWHEERRADKAADAQQRRDDKVFSANLRRDERRRDREEDRERRAQRRRERAQRRQARAAKRERSLTPGHVYKRGTLLLITLSALASLPAQIIHFVSISWMLFPIGPAVEGAAWVTSAGVAYADEKKLPVWVRWLLRALAFSSASFAASINYQYGLSLTGHGMSEADARMAGLGLAAVTMLGPMFFEVRQWVLTLSAAVVNPKQKAEARARKAEAKSRARHEKQRRDLHKDVAAVADALLADAPFGTLSKDEAWERARLIVHGTTSPGMTPALVAMAAESAESLAQAQKAAKLDDEALRKRIESAFQRTDFVLPTAPGTPFNVAGTVQRVTQIPPSPEVPAKGPVKVPPKPAVKAGRKKPMPPRRKPGDTPRYHSAAKLAAADTARKLAVVNGSR